MCSPISLSIGPGLLRSLHDLRHPPVYRLGQRPRLHDPDGITDLGVALVPSLHLLRPRDLLAVDRVRVAAHERHGDGLFHLVAGHHAHTRFPAGSRGRFGLFCHVRDPIVRSGELGARRKQELPTPDSQLPTSLSKSSGSARSPAGWSETASGSRSIQWLSGTEAETAPR